MKSFYNRYLDVFLISNFLVFLFLITGVIAEEVFQYFDQPLLLYCLVRIFIFIQYLGFPIIAFFINKYGLNPNFRWGCSLGCLMYLLLAPHWLLEVYPILNDPMIRNLAIVGGIFMLTFFIGDYGGKIGKRREQSCLKEEDERLAPLFLLGNASDQKQTESPE